MTSVGKSMGKVHRKGHNSSVQLQLHLMMLPGTLSIIIFSIIPLFGLVIAFTDFKASMGWDGIFTAAWNDFTNFRRIFSARDFYLWSGIQ